MPETVSSSASETDTPAVVVTLMQMISGYWVTQIVRTAVDLSIPDHLATESLTPEEIAERESSDPRTTYRLLRACASLGLVACEGDRRFSGTPMSELLQSGVPNTLRELALVWAGPSHWRPWERMPEAVRKAGTQIEAVLGTDFFSYLAGRPEEAALFLDALERHSRVHAVDVVLHAMALIAYYSQTLTAADVNRLHNLLVEFNVKKLGPLPRKELLVRREQISTRLKTNRALSKHKSPAGTTVFAASPEDTPEELDDGQGRHLDGYVSSVRAVLRIAPIAADFRCGSRGELARSLAKPEAAPLRRAGPDRTSP